MRAALRALALTGVLLAAAASSAGASGPSDSFSFFSPSKNIDCEMDVGRIGCGTSVPTRAVFLYPGGLLRSNTAGGDVGADARLLPYGHSHTVGPFRCTMRTNGVTCVVVRTGHGFRLARAGVTALPTAAPGFARFWDGTRAQTRPTSFWYTGDGTGELVDIRWTSFGGATASGTAVDRENDCTPDCADGSFNRVPARFTLSHPVVCHGRSLYSSVLVVDQAGRAASGRYPLYTGCNAPG